MYKERENMNKITLIGNLVRDPEMRVTPKGISSCRFTIAVDRKYKVDGEKVTDYFQITTWRNLAESCNRNLSKGKKVCAVGELQASAYEAKDGQPKPNLNVNADEVEFLSPRDGSSHSSEDAPAAGTPAVDENGFTDLSSDDIPF